MTNVDEIVYYESILTEGMVLDGYISNPHGMRPAACAPLCEGFAMPHTVLCWIGHDLAEHLMKNTIEQRYSLIAAAEREFAWDVKEKSCYIASDYDTVLTSTRGKRQMTLCPAT